MSDDSLIRISLAHEFYRCKHSFELFVLLSSIVLSGKCDKNIALLCYNAYADFVSHLYEFYLGCIKRDARFSKNLTSIRIDEILNTEVEKLLKLRQTRILRGDAPSWENDISFYQSEVPREFAYSFRTVRNIRAHADPRRASFSLSDFYKKYHRFIYLLYTEPQWLWNIDDLNQHDWKEIEMFSRELFEQRT